jgi:hypothetical protein
MRPVTQLRMRPTPDLMLWPLGCLLYQCPVSSTGRCVQLDCVPALLRMSGIGDWQRGAVDCDWCNSVVGLCTAVLLGGS